MQINSSKKYQHQIIGIKISLTLMRVLYIGHLNLNMSHFSQNSGLHTWLWLHNKVFSYQTLLNYKLYIYIRLLK